MHISRAKNLVLRVLSVAAVIAAAIVLSAGAHATNIVQNPGFENGLASWTGPDVGADNTDPRTGSSAAFFGTGTLTQSLTAATGASYAISFYLAANATTLSNASVATDASFDMAFSGVDLTNSPISAIKRFKNKGKQTNEYVLFTFTGVASVDDPALTFTSLQPTSNPGTWYLDDVSVQLVPEPAALPLLLTALVAWPMVGRLRRMGRRG